MVNKWDLVPDKDNHTLQEFTDHIRQEFAYLDYAPIVFVSAKTKQRLGNLPAMIGTVSENQNRRIQSAVLNDVLVDAWRSPRRDD